MGRNVNDWLRVAVKQEASSLGGRCSIVRWLHWAQVEWSGCICDSEDYGYDSLERILPYNTPSGCTLTPSNGRLFCV
ncbi:hypothetical protein MRX96_016434 [Rhipicephalus microplus]